MEKTALKRGKLNNRGTYGEFNSECRASDCEREIFPLSRFPTNFKTLVSRSPPAIPNCLLKKVLDASSSSSDNNGGGMGKIRVILKVAFSQNYNCLGDAEDLQQQQSRHFQIDQRKRQVTLYDPTVFRGGNGSNSNKPASADLAPEERKIGVAAPKMFAFDGLFTAADSQENLCGEALPDVIQSVIGGSDGCLFCYGHANLGKTKSMLGSDGCSRDMGAIPIAIAWLYRAIKEKKAKTGARFSVRVSALEITSQREELRDLLAPYETETDGESPAVYLRHLPLSGSCLQNQSELRASSAEKAAFYLDAALAGRSLDAQGRESHLLFTLHVYQYSVDARGNNAVHGGRSRLHLIDFGGCERTGGGHRGGGITLSGLGNVILGIFNGQKHLPHRESKVTQVLRECLGSLTCQATMLAHVSPEPSHYSETLHTVQLASRLHRMRRKRMKNGEEHRRRKFRSRSSSSGRSSSDITTSGTSTSAYSSSEMSCDTVVYRGGHSDGSGTDGEQPPVFLPYLRSINGSSAPSSLRGSLDEIPRPRRRTSGSKILTNGAISPRRNLSPQPNQQQVRSPHRSLSSLPVIHEVHTNSRKMPLNGLVPVQGRRRENRAVQQQEPPREQWIDAPPPQPPQPKQNVQEVWIDGVQNVVRPNQQQQPHNGKYGYMDEHKADMINNWVETQTAEQHPNFRVLTQFKTCDNNIEAEDAIGQRREVAVAQIHNNTPVVDSEDFAPKSKKCPPPPPPKRLTPSREDINNGDNLSVLMDECNQLAKRFTGSPDNNNEHSSNIVINHTTCGHRGEFETGDAKFREEDATPPPLPPPTQHVIEEHPLRILSEENLTVVSSFAGGSNGELNAAAGGEDDEDEIDPSALSFFEVPDFNSIKENMDKQENFISERFKEFAQLERNIEPSPEKEEPEMKVGEIVPTREEQVSTVVAKNVEETEEKEGVEVTDKYFHDPRFIPGNSEQGEVLLTFSRHNNNNNNNNLSSGRHWNLIHQNQQKPSPEQPMRQNDITPQRQFLLLAQSLRHPDGSSNPELNKFVPKLPQGESAIPSKRSPGNGRSSSDMEDDIANENEEAGDANGNNQQPSSVEGAPEKKKSSFGSRFLRLFGSTRKLNKSGGSGRSKSCERSAAANNNGKVEWTHSKFNIGIRPATSSPNIKSSEKTRSGREKRGSSSRSHGQLPPPDSSMVTPSTLSISTDWEYQEQQKNDSNNGRSVGSSGFFGKHLMSSSTQNKTANNKSVKDRKSSGYDSLGGESSSLDSNQGSPMSNDAAANDDDDDTLLLKQKLLRCSDLESNPRDPPYATPNDNVQIIQYDELDILRMEHRLRNIYS